MKILLILSLLLLPTEQANAARYNFSQIFSDSSQSSIVGSFDVAATSGIVNESQIRNFSISINFDPWGWRGNELDRRITFNVDTNELNIFVSSIEILDYSDPSSGEGRVQERTYKYSGSSLGPGTLGTLNLDCLEFPTGSTFCGARAPTNFNTSNPIIVTQNVVPLPGALGLFTLGLALTGFINRRFKKL